MAVRRVAIVPHTHWDREWYHSYQEFRLKLVDTLDTLLTLLESDDSYAHFMLDGQMAVVDDYLEVRPEGEERLVALAAAGRLSMGPWYILMDEFLASGETIIRNLQMGLRRGAAFGGTMPVGYLPDMFGHIAQMPQILSQAGLADAVVWRGVPSAITRSGFWWEAPDGSTVRAEYLPDGYGNGAALPDDAKALVERTAELIEDSGAFVLGDLLCMNGSDHLMPQPELGRVVAEANALQDDIAFSVTSLPRYLAAAPREGLERWRGELRSGSRANMLMGVTSNRVDVKRSGELATRQLERRAEPLAALFQPPSAWPQRQLDLAWKEVVRNSAHDSICACSVDDVVDAVLHRYTEARTIATGLADRAIRSLARSMATPGDYVLNPAARPRSGVVELVVGADDPPAPGVQVLSEEARPTAPRELDTETVRTILKQLQGPQIEHDAWLQDIAVEEDDDGISVLFSVGPEERRNVPIAQAKRDIVARMEARPDAAIRLGLDQRPTRRIVARVDEVAGYGWRPFQPVPAVHPATASGPGEPVALSNGLVSIEVDEQAGTFSLNGIGPATAGWWTAGTWVTPTTTHPPQRTASWTHRMRWPSGSSSPAPCGPGWSSPPPTCSPTTSTGGSKARVGTQATEIETILELRADEPALRVTTSFVNQSRDHRLRVHLPLPRPAETSQAECAFAVVERGLTAEGGPDEFGLPTAPARRFVSAGGLTVVHDGVCEYELVDIDPRSRRGPSDNAGLDRGAVHGHVVPGRHGLPALPGRPGDPGGGTPDDRPPDHPPLRAGPGCRRPLRPGRRHPSPPRGGDQQWGWCPPSGRECVVRLRCRSECRPKGRGPDRGPRLQSPFDADDGVDSRSVGMAGRSAGLPPEPLRWLVRSAAPRTGDGQAARRRGDRLSRGPTPGRRAAGRSTG